MKSQFLVRTCLLASITALNLAFVTTSQAQNAPSNPGGSSTDSKTSDGSVAEKHDDMTGSPSDQTGTVDKTGSKNYSTNSLDKNPSLAPTDSADKSATKDPIGTTSDTDTEKHSGKSEKYSDKHFLMKAAQGGMTEVELGKIAEKNGSSSDVKDFGSHMVTDHGKANDELKSVAGKKNITVPSTLDAHHQAVVDKFSKLSGAEFDKAYVAEMVKDHKKDSAEFQKASTTSTDPDVKDFATKTLTVVNDHLKMIEDIQSKMK